VENKNPEEGRGGYVTRKRTKKKVQKKNKPWAVKKEGGKKIAREGTMGVGRRKTRLRKLKQKTMVMGWGEGGTLALQR